MRSLLEIGRKYFCSIIMIVSLYIWEAATWEIAFGLAAAFLMDLCFTARAIEIPFYSQSFDLNEASGASSASMTAWIIHISFILLGSVFPLLSGLRGGLYFNQSLAAIGLIFVIFPFSIFGLRVYFSGKESPASLIKKTSVIPIDFSFVEVFLSVKSTVVIVNSFRMMLGFLFLLPYIFLIDVGLADWSFLNLSTSIACSLFFSVGVWMIFLSLLRLARLDFAR